MFNLRIEIGNDLVFVWTTAFFELHTGLIVVVSIVLRVKTVNIYLTKSGRVGIFRHSGLEFVRLMSFELKHNKQKT